MLSAALAIAALGGGLAIERRLELRRRRSRSRRRRRRRHLDRRKLAIAGAACAVLAVGALVASGAPSRLYDRTQDGPVQAEGGAERERLTDTRAQSRAKYWGVSVDAFRAQPLHGSGAGAFVEDWNRDREVAEDAAEGHSLYVETLGELGVVGVALLFAALGAMLWPLAAGLRGRRRRLYAGVAAGAVTWLAHAGLDWDWEMPVLTLWLVATCGAALGVARQRSGAVRRRSGWRARGIAAGACVIASLTPATFALSQNRLDDSARALTAGDCPGADVAARKATDWVAARPEPYAIRAYCAVRTGNEAEAVTLMESARDREPRNWKYSYGLALMQAVNGDDPRPAARRALALNPLEDMTVSAVEWFSTGTERQWRRRALAAPVPRP
jgi:O-antigen ligase